MTYPEEYNKEQYIKWHKKQFKENNLEKGLIKNREKLKKIGLEKLNFTAELLHYVIQMCKKEYKTNYGSEFDCIIPLTEVLKNKQDLKYELLFKSVESTINKLWRKNKVGKNVNLTNLNVILSDLIRTEIICSTLSSCEYISKRLILENINLPDDYHLKEKLNEMVSSISFEPSMKMSSGYFAYHGIIEFIDGLKIELQIYSSLTSTWRKLSHKLYEKARLGFPTQINFATSEARLISLGHLLHLAECEVQRLEKEIIS